MHVVSGGWECFGTAEDSGAGAEMCVWGGSFLVESVRGLSHFSPWVWGSGCFGNPGSNCS